MDNKMLVPGTEEVVIAYSDLVRAWTVLEKLTVSLEKIGSHHAVPDGRREQTVQEAQRMFESIGRFLTPELSREISVARGVLLHYLPNEEAEAMSDQLNYWEPSQDTRPIAGSDQTTSDQ